MGKPQVDRVGQMIEDMEGFSNRNPIPAFLGPRITPAFAEETGGGGRLRSEEPQGTDGHWIP